MLRIVTEQHGSAYTISLHGRLAGQWVGLLDRYWLSIIEDAPSAAVTTVLSDVSFVDTEGEQLLERMWRRGTHLVTSGCMNRYLIDRIRSRNGDESTTRRYPR